MENLIPTIVSITGRLWKNAFESIPRIAAAALLALFFMSGPASATVITLDGVLDGSDEYSNSEQVNWFNGHETDNSIYGNQDNPLGTTTIHWGFSELANDTSDNPLGTEYFFLYVDVPLYAKNMIWEDRDWRENPIVNKNSSTGLTEADVGSYRVHHETHHNPGDMKLDFKGATDSEKMEFFDADGNKVFEADLGGGVGKAFDLLSFKNSVDYLFDNGLANNELSLNRDTKMSFEFQFGMAQSSDLLSLITDDDFKIAFHLSPERGLNPVPEPATMVLFGSGLIGLAGMVRRKNSKS